MSLAQYNGSDTLRNRRVYFSGTTALRKGQVLCYDLTATKLATDPKTRLGTQVVDVAAAAGNKNAVAGIVPDYEVGKVGPTFVEVIQPAPGDTFDVEVEGTTAVAAGDVLKGDNTLGALIKDAAAAIGQTYAKALEAQAAVGKVVIRALKV
jgi:hypothetical protein